MRLEGPSIRIIAEPLIAQPPLEQQRPAEAEPRPHEPVAQAAPARR